MCHWIFQEVEVEYANGFLLRKSQDNNAFKPLKRPNVLTWLLLLLALDRAHKYLIYLLSQKCSSFFFYLERNIFDMRSQNRVSESQITDIYKMHLNIFTG
jgi:hypothetical protein